MKAGAVLIPIFFSHEQTCHLYLTMKEKGDMLRTLARNSEDPVVELSLIQLNDEIVLNLESYIMRPPGFERERQPAGGLKKAPAGYDWR